MKHIIGVIVENRPGVLARVIGLISGRGYNIESLNVAPTHDETVSHITMTVPGDDRVLEQVTKQLNKLIDVIKVYDLTGKKYLESELMLIKVSATQKNRSAVIEVATLFNAKIVNVQPKSLTIQVVGTESELNNFIELVKTNGILEMSRTGVIAMGLSD